MAFHVLISGVSDALIILTLSHLTARATPLFLRSGRASAMESFETALTAREREEGGKEGREGGREEKEKKC